MLATVTPIRRRPAIGLDPVGFERIGQIPNDMDLGGLPAPGAAQPVKSLRLSRPPPQTLADRQHFPIRARRSEESRSELGLGSSRAASPADITNITGGQNTLCFASG